MTQFGRDMSHVYMTHFVGCVSNLSLVIGFMDVGFYRPSYVFSRTVATYCGAHWFWYDFVIFWVTFVYVCIFVTFWAPYFWARYIYLFVTYNIYRVCT